jgi:hypothetical protein
MRRTAEMDNNTLAYLGARMKEASSWGGAAAFILAALHLSASPDVVNAALSVVAATGGLIAVLVPEGSSAQAPGGG